MKLQVAPYNNGATTWAEAEETELRHYTIEHKFNQPARCNIVLADPTGSLMRKYNCDANDVYIGAGRLTLEDPTATDIFYGRIEKAIGNSLDKTLTLECKDWMVQLDDEQITYDMREKIGAGDFRQSTAHADPDGAFVDVAQNDAGTYYFWDDGNVWANDVYNGMKLVFTTEMAGVNTWSFGPYTHVTTAGIGIDTDSFDGDLGDLWDDDVLGHLIADNDENYTVDYFFRVWLGHNTPSDFYVHNSVTGARLHVTYFLTVTGVEGKVQINNDADTTYYDIGHLEPTDDAVYKHVIFEIPGAAIDDGIVTASGISEVRFDIDHNGVAADLSIRYLRLEIDCTTTGYSTAITINDTINPNKLEVATDLTAAATRIWEGVPYCIAQTIPYHLDTDLGGTLLTTGDDNVALTATDVELTTGVSTRQYKDKTRLKIVQDLADQDKSVFWIPLGTTAFKYKQTFGADTVTIDDGDVLGWTTQYDFGRIVNEYHVYGARINEYEVYQSATNAASETKYLATKTKTLRNAGITSDMEAAAIATALAARDAEHLLPTVIATVSGNTATAAHPKTMVLGDIVEITSSYLWNTAAKDYVITGWAYDSRENKTQITFMPKVSIGYQPLVTPYNQGIVIIDKQNEAEEDKYVAPPTSNEVA